MYGKIVRSPFLLIKNDMKMVLTVRSLAIAEMKYLLKEVYSRFRTRIASEMKGSMEMSDQIISSRPLGQTCMLVFERIEKN